MSWLEILIILLLLLPPVVLWRCKKFCERHPSTVAFRAVPLGCLTMFLLMALGVIAVPWLWANPPEWLFSCWRLLAATGGIAVIVLLARRLNRGRAVRPHGCLYPIIFISYALVVWCIMFHIVLVH